MAFDFGEACSKDSDRCRAKAFFEASYSWAFFSSRAARRAARFSARGAVGIATDDRAGTHAGDGGADRGGRGHAVCLPGRRVGETLTREWSAKWIRRGVAER